MSPTTDRLAGRIATTEQPLTGGASARQAQTPGPVAPPVALGPGPTSPSPLVPEPRTAAAGTSTSPGGATVRAGALPGDTRGLSGAEWRTAAKRAQSKSRRSARSAAAKPAATVTVPPPATGAALTATARCLRGCGVIAGPGDPAEVDKVAERHTTKPPKHPTSVASEVTT